MLALRFSIERIFRRSFSAALTLTDIHLPYCIRFLVLSSWSEVSKLQPGIVPRQSGTCKHPRSVDSSRWYTVRLVQDMSTLFPLDAMPLRSRPGLTMKRRRRSLNARLFRPLSFTLLRPGLLRVRNLEGDPARSPLSFQVIGRWDPLP